MVRLKGIGEPPNPFQNVTLKRAEIGRCMRNNGAPVRRHVWGPRQRLRSRRFSADARTFRITQGGFLPATRFNPLWHVQVNYLRVA